MKDNKFSQNEKPHSNAKSSGHGDDNKADTDASHSTTRIEVGTSSPGSGHGDDNKEEGQQDCP